jgi:hypothetical protein
MSTNFFLRCVAVIVSLCLLGCRATFGESGEQVSYVQPDQWRFSHTTTTQTCKAGMKCNVIVQDECIDVPFPRPHRICRKWVNYDETRLAKDNPEIDIIWKLEDNFYFCAGDGDGVFLKGSNDGQFDGMY